MLVCCASGNVSVIFCSNHLRLIISSQTVFHLYDDRQLHNHVVVQSVGLCHYNDNWTHLFSRFCCSFFILPLLYNKYVYTCHHSFQCQHHDFNDHSDLRGRSIRTQCTRSGGTRSVVGCYMGTLPLWLSWLLSSSLSSLSQWSSLSSMSSSSTWLASLSPFSR